MRLDHDLHVHTYLSDCCQEKERQTPAAILALAEEMGLRTIGFADHMWLNPNLPPTGWYAGLNESLISKLRNDLAAVETKVRVLVGCEAETVAPGKYGISEEFAQELDFVLLACDHFHLKGIVAQPESSAPHDVARHMLELFCAAVSTSPATAIAHPFSACGYQEIFDQVIDSIPDDEFLDAFGIAQERGIAIEINRCFIPRYAGFDFSIETPIRFLSLAKQAGCKFTLGTDAHGPEAQSKLPGLAALTEAVGVAEEDILPLVRHGATRS